MKIDENLVNMGKKRVLTNELIEKKFPEKQSLTVQ
jgi:hypothetical protein